ncbi:MAG: tetratricopeptide repeat protein, partial [Candidatus Kariarchaeaceae archaeon]
IKDLYYEKEIDLNIEYLKFLLTLPVSTQFKEYLQSIDLLITDNNLTKSDNEAIEKICQSFINSDFILVNEMIDKITSDFNLSHIMKFNLQSLKARSYAFNQQKNQCLTQIEVAVETYNLLKSDEKLLLIKLRNHYNNNQDLRFLDKGLLRSDYAYLLNLKGIMYGSMGEYSISLENFDECRIIREESSNSLDIADTYQNIGNTHRKLYNIDDALYYAEKSININQQLGKTDRISNSLVVIGNVLALINDYDNAIKRINEGITICNQHGDQNSLLRLNYHKSDILRYQMDLTNAINSLNDNKLIYQKLVLEKNVLPLDSTFYGNSLFSLIILNTEVKDYNTAKIHYNDLCQLQKLVKIKTIDNLVNLATAFREYRNNQNFEISKTLLYSIIDDKIENIEVTINSILMLTEILLSEIEDPRVSPNIIQEVKTLIPYLKELAEQYKLHSLNIKFLLIELKIANLQNKNDLADKNLKTINSLLSQQKIITIKYEDDLFSSLQDMLDQLETEPSLLGIVANEIRYQRFKIELSE